MINPGPCFKCGKLVRWRGLRKVKMYGSWFRRWIYWCFDHKPKFTEENEDGTC